MPNLNARLARIEAARAAATAADEGAIIARLVDHVQDQPPEIAAAFWRVNREQHAPADTSDEARYLCGGLFTVTADDREAYARLTDAFFGGKGRPVPSAELA
jgi:hypothetical protein